MLEKLPKCLIRVDGSQSIGTGHIMRCLALANELKEQGNEVTFLLGLCPEPLKKRLSEEGHPLFLLPDEIRPGSEVDSRFAAGLAEELKAKRVIVDGYHFLTEYQRLLKQADLALLYIDDLAHCDYYFADFILNQNPAADKSLYPNLQASTKLLLGLDYVLLRQEFINYKKKNAGSDCPPVAKNILVTMGGSDIDNVTGRVIEALSQAPSTLALQVTAVVGGGNQHARQLQAFAEHLNDNGTHKFKILVNATNMAELLGTSDLIISAGGTTIWEAAYLGKATAVVITAANQQAGMNHFAAAQAVELIGQEQDLQTSDLTAPLMRLIEDQRRRRQLGETAAKTIDGAGAGRVAQVINGAR